MICIFAPNPSNVEKKEGYMQRVSAIDGIFADTKKIYFEDIINIDEQKSILFEASVIYVHSIYQVRWMAEIYKIFSDKIITDLHGIVPEEEAYIGSQETAKEMAEVEKTVFEHGKVFVAVSQKMVDHYNKKYKLDGGVEWIILPIFNERTSLPKRLSYKKRLQVIYAGGMQQWQKPELMVDAIKKRRDYNYHIFTHHTDVLSGMLNNDTTLDGLVIGSKSKDDIVLDYSKSDLGLVIRDNHVLNTVSCPTKLIEYLSHGVVPIVLYPDMGDFVKFGYKFVLYEDFINKQLKQADIYEASKHNLKIIKKMKKLSGLNIKKLRDVIGKLQKTTATISNKSDIAVEDMLKRYKYILDLSNRVKFLENQISKKNNEIATLRATISDMSHSKRWLLGDFISRSKNIGRWKFRK